MEISSRSRAPNSENNERWLNPLEMTMDPFLASTSSTISQLTAMPMGMYSSIITKLAHDKTNFFFDTLLLSGLTLFAIEVTGLIYEMGGVICGWGKYAKLLCTQEGG